MKYIYIYIYIYICYNVLVRVSCVFTTSFCSFVLFFFHNYNFYFTGFNI
ncbi:MAG: hypothetical protein MCS20_02375 [Candidatus Phytoplasma mali]|nr:hypothetical protein [Candidatus Phytoplasma mali]